MDCEDSMYLSHSNNIKDSFDCDYIQKSELCYDCIGGENLYSCVGSDQCYNCSHLTFCIDCIGCSSCFGCYGLRNASYQIFNVQYSKEEYDSYISKLGLSRLSAYQKWADICHSEIRANHPRREYLVNCEASSGNFLVNCHKSENCFDSFALEHCKNCTWTFDSNNCQEVYGMGSSEWAYECVGVEKLTQSMFCTFVSHSGNAAYSDLCFYCSDIFGCVGLKQKKYSILNRPYDRNSFENLREKLIGHIKETGEWGKFFPIKCSPFAYNESIAQERLPISEEQANKLGLPWKKAEQKTLSHKQDNQLPDDVFETSPAITQQVLECAITGKAFKINPKEYNFYLSQKLPIPRLCPDQRYANRFARRPS